MVTDRQDQTHPHGEIRCPNCDEYYDSRDLKPQGEYGVLCPACRTHDPGR